MGMSVLVENHGGEVPQTREALEALPGVGRTTANVILNTAFGQPTIAVDTHIFRVSNRTGIAPGKNVDEVEKRLLKFVPDEFKLDAHHWLILHGRYICKARTPECPSCGIADLCEFRSKTRAARDVQSQPRRGPQLLFRPVGQVPQEGTVGRLGDNRPRHRAATP